MSGLPRQKKIIALIVVILVLIIPTYMALTASGGLFASNTQFGSRAADNGEEGDGGAASQNPPEAPSTRPGMLSTSYRDEIAAPFDVSAGGDEHETSQPDGEQDPLFGISSPLFTPRPASLLESVSSRPTTTPSPTPTPKWMPENIATDGERILDGLVEEDSVNVLILGIDRVAYLMDTMGVVSISPSKKSVRLIMLPRDQYIGYSEEVLGLLQKMGHLKLAGIHKINNVYNVANNSKDISDTVYNRNKFGIRGYDFLAQVLYEKFDIVIDDFVQVNTRGFVRLVDTFGGVSVYVPTYMRYSDPTQGLYINIPKGTQYLNGASAEGFVRFREGYDGSGRKVVFQDRTKNQAAFIKAFYEQHAKISNITKIPEVIDILNKNIVHSVDADELFTRYIDLFTLVVDEAYTFDSISFVTGNRRINGAAYLEIQSVAEAEG